MISRRLRLTTAILAVGIALSGCSTKTGSTAVLGPAKPVGTGSTFGDHPTVRTPVLALIENYPNLLAHYPRSGPTDVAFGSPAVITGSNTELSTPFGVGTNGKVIVVGNVGHSGLVCKGCASSTIHLLIWGTGAPGGNTPPSREITGPNTMLQAPEGVAVDEEGDIFVADSGANAILVFAGTSRGDVAPIGVISGSNTTLRNPTRIALDGQDNMWVSNGGNRSILEFAADDFGNVAPVVTITGSKTLLAGVAGIAVTKVGQIFATNYILNDVLVFTSGSNGNVAPARIISGSFTQLNYPTGITLDLADGEILVASHFASQVNAYGIFADGNVPPVSILKDANTQGVFDVSFH
jgi:hypothetical protein